MSDADGNSEINKAISAIKLAVGSVEKRGRNDFHRYDYATAADIFHALQHLMGDAGLTVIAGEVDSNFIGDGSILAIRYAFTLHHNNGSTHTERPIITGMSAAKNSKGGYDDKAANKCLTAATKYFLLNLFKIPTGDYDDSDGQEDVGVEYITQDQNADLQRLMSANKVPNDVVCKAMNVKGLKSIPANKYDEVITRVKSYIANRAKEAPNATGN
jgi:hypothetical protein